MGYDMWWMEKAEPDAVARYEEIHRQWEVSVQVRDAIPREEHGNFTKEELDAGALWDGAGVPANASPRYRAAQELQDRLYEEMSRAEIWYCRRNIWGMRILREVMHRLDMVRSNYSMDECPFPWPECTWADEDGDDYYDWSGGNWSKEHEEEFEQQQPDVLKAWRTFKEAQDARLTWVPEECFKIGLILDGTAEGIVIDETPHAIPLHKFSSNDGWIVTATECSAVLAKVKDLDDDLIRKVYIAAGADWDPIESWQSWLTFIEGAASHGGFEVR